MSEISRKELIAKIQHRSIEERRQRQYLQLKAWDLGKTTPNQCIEAIVDLEKIIFLGDQVKIIRKK